MSSPVLHTLKNSVAAASAALFIQIGSAAAATQARDFQQQVRKVLTGTLVSPPAARPDSRRPDPHDRNADTQAFVRGLLLGVSSSYRATTDERPRPKGALRVARSTTTDEDTQSAVRQVLLGQHASMEGAL